MPVSPPVHRRNAAGARHQDKAEVNRQASRGMHTASAGWRAIRLQVLIRDNYTCAACGRYGDQVDHVDGDATNDAPDGSNYQVLCRSCHGVKTGGETGRVRMLPVLKRRPLMPVTVIAGPPGSGKSTWARKQAGPRDMVLDLDELKARRSGTAVHDTPDDALMPALAERNQILFSLSRRRDLRHVWFVCMAPRLQERRHWRENLHADVVVLEVSPEECLRRIAADPTRKGKDPAFWERVVADWWKRYVREAPGGGDFVIRT